MKPLSEWIEAEIKNLPEARPDASNDFVHGLHTGWETAMEIVLEELKDREEATRKNKK